MAADVVAFTDMGADAIVVYMADTWGQPKYVHWGTGTTPAAAGDVALVTPGTESRVGTNAPTHVTTQVFQVIQTLTCNATGKSITEAGLFDAATSGNIFVRATFDAIPVVQNDTIEFTFTMTFT